MLCKFDVMWLKRLQLVNLKILKRTKNNNIHVYTCTLSTYTMHVFTYYLVIAERSLGLLCSSQVVASTRCRGPSALLQKFVKADPKMDKDWKESDHSAQLHLNRTFNHQKYIEILWKRSYHKHESSWLQSTWNCIPTSHFKISVPWKWITIHNRFFSEQVFVREQDSLIQLRSFRKLGACQKNSKFCVILW